MSLLRWCASTLAILTITVPFVANAQIEKTFPTDAEINLVLTQTERAILQYKPLIDLQAVHLGKSGLDTVARERDVVSALETAIKALKGKPQGFNGPLGFKFFELLDDASRNAALCAGGSSIRVLSEVMDGNKDKAESQVHLAQSCADASALIYTVSENAGSLYERYVLAEEELAVQANDVAESVRSC